MAFLKVNDKRLKARGITLLSVLAVAMSAMAIPARRDGKLCTAADGTEKMVYMHGDEAFHYLTDEAGLWLDEETLLPLSEEQKSVRRQQGKARVTERRAAQQIKVGGVPNIAPRGLLIMVNFKDQAFQTPRDTVDSMLNGINYSRRYDYNYDWKGKHYEGTTISHGSARQYFYDQSYGQYNPEFDVVGPYTLDKNVGGYDDNNVGQMIKKACELADADGVDFTRYDNNDDGKVDFVYVLYAGYGEADSYINNTIWPHNWYLSKWGISYYADGKRVDNYACSNEINYLSQVYTGIGTFVHEFGHVIGLPDLYVTVKMDNPPHTLNEWDIMDYGCYSNDGNTPPAYSAYERFYCGWLTPRVLTVPENVTLQPINEGNGQSLLISSTDQHNLVGYDPYPTTFYLLEARTLTEWDEYLPGAGLLITKVAYDPSKWSGNSVNNDAESQGIQIMEATPNSTIYGAPTDVYPAGGNQWTGLSEHVVTNIAQQPDGSITFLYRGGDPAGVEDVQDNNKPYTKILRNGNIYIIRDNKEYTILGHENHQL